MVSFILSLVALILGYLLYGRFVEKVFGPDDRVTPAVAKADGVDYLVLPGWKIFMIQFLNIAGTGPIFGAILGAKFGPVAYLWIVRAGHGRDCKLEYRACNATFPRLYPPAFGESCG